MRMNLSLENKLVTIDDLKLQLNNAGIEFSNWGRGNTKALKYLYNEIKKGESILFIDDNGKLKRKLRVVGADIFYTDINEQTYNLREEKQVFKNGSERIRYFDYSVGEKMELNEVPISAIRRGIKEELGIMSIVDISEWKQDEKVWESNSYPGLMTEHYRYWFIAILTNEQYNKNGYIEKQEDKDTYFIWNKIG